MIAFQGREFQAALLLAGLLLAAQLVWSWPRALEPGRPYLVTHPSGAGLRLYQPTLEGATVKAGRQAASWTLNPVWSGRSPGPVPLRPGGAGFVSVDLLGYSPRTLPLPGLFGGTGRYPARGALALEPVVPVLVPLVYAMRDYCFALAACLVGLAFWGLRIRPRAAAARRQERLRKGFRDGEAPLGLRLHDYTIEEPLGEGGMARVYRARRADDPDGEPRALKLLSGRADEESWARFLREADICRELNHPHIVHLYDWGDLDGHPYLVLELIEGRTLSSRLAEEPDLGQLVGWAAQVAEALVYAHGRGVVHRDLKPSNVMIRDRDQKAIVMDFGISRREDLAQVTQAGDVLGTPGYMAPEQLGGVPPDYRADLYALGALLYEAVGGRPAFAGGTVLEVIQAQATGRLVPLRSLRPEVPEPLEKLIHRLLDLDPTVRAENRSQVLGELQLLLSSGL